MATIGNVVISVFASTKGLSKSLESAQKRIKKFADNAIKKLKTIGSAVAIGVGGAVSAGIAIVEKYAAEIDKLAKTASKIGTTIGGLQKLQYQAELTGVGADTLNMALQRMVRRVAEAANGTGEAKNALKELGVNAKELSKLSPDEQFYRLADAMKNVSSQGDKVRLSMKLFDSEGVALVNTMNSNLNQTGSEFESLGIKVTQSQAAMVEAYNDSKTKLGAIFSGFGLKLTAQLAEPFKIVIEWITKVIMEMGGMEGAANNFAKFIVKAIKVSVTAVQSLIAGFVKLENLMLRIENIKLLPAIAAEAIASQVAGTPGDAGINTQKAFDNDAQIARNNAELANNSNVKALDELLNTLEKQIGKKIDMSDVIKPEHLAPIKKAANDANIMAESTKKAAEKTDLLAKAAGEAAQKLSPGKVVPISSSSHFSKAKGLNPGLSALSISGSASSVVNSNSAKSVVDKNNVSIGKIDINMQTDTGKVAGEIFGEPAFLSNLKAFSERQTHKEAKVSAL